MRGERPEGAALRQAGQQGGVVHELRACAGPPAAAAGDGHVPGNELADGQAVDGPGVRRHLHLRLLQRLEALHLACTLRVSCDTLDVLGALDDAPEDASTSSSSALAAG